MLSNPFRRKQRQAPQSSPEKPRITIAMARGGKSSGGGSAQSPSQSSSGHQQPQQQQQQSLVLPPESSYRTSLIMPHLTRRFTLLRAPDGTMVTPDAMRAHLRAQRARARATGQPGANFLTEQEEDEIIDQMKRQTQLHNEQQAQQYAQQTSSLGHGADGSLSDFGGTDGFGGGLASHYSYASSRASADRIGSLAESLGDLPTISASSSSGSLFSGRSSERDNAYLRSLDKTKQPPAVIQEETEDEGEDAPDAESEEESIPGGFNTSSRTASRLSQQPQQEFTTPEAVPRANGNGTHLGPPGAHQSQLLTTLSPDAFRRVSTALQEVIGIVSPDSIAGQGGPRGGQDGNGLDQGGSYDYEAQSVGTSEGEGDDEDGGDDDARVNNATRDATSYDAAANDADDEDDSDDERHDYRKHIGGGSGSTASGSRGAWNAGGAASPESDAVSFLSAHEEATPSLAHGHADASDSPPRVRNGAGVAANEDDDDDDDDSQTDRQQPQFAIDSRPRDDFGGEDLSSAYLPNDGLYVRNDDDGDDDARNSSAYVADEATPRIPQAATPTLQKPDLPSVTPMPSEPRDSSDTASGTAATTATAATNAKSPNAPEAATAARSFSPPPRSPPSATPQSAATAFSFDTVGSPRRAPSRNHMDGPDDVMRWGRPLSPDSSGVQAPVLSAHAIAARSQRYFPPISATATPQSYASGFRSSPAQQQTFQYQQQQQTPSSASAGSASRQNAYPGEAAAGATAAASALAYATQANGHAADQVNGNGTVSEQQQQPRRRSSDFAPERPSEDVSSLTAGGLFPQPPSDPSEAEKWRQTYGTRSTIAADGASSAGGSDAALSEFERQFEQEADGDDVWATVARNLRREDEGDFEDYQPDDVGGEGDGNADGPGSRMGFRPVSHIPPAEAASRFEGAGFTMDSLAQLQANLVRSASTKQLAGGNASGSQQQPALYERGREDSFDQQQQPAALAAATPTMPKMSSSSSLSRDGNYAYGGGYVPGSGPASPSASKLEKARERARMIAERTRSPTGSISGSLKFQPSNRSLDRTAQQQQERPSGSSTPDRPFPYDGSSQVMTPLTSIYDDRDSSSRPQQSGMTHSTSMRSFKSQVMYDVTTSHRPTSPPPRRTSGASAALPSLQDLTLHGFQPIPPVVDPNRHSMTLSQAMDATADNFETAAAPGERAADNHRGSSANGHDGGLNSQHQPLGGTGSADYGGLFTAQPEAIPEEARDWAAYENQESYDADGSTAPPFSPDQSWNQGSGQMSNAGGAGAGSGANAGAGQGLQVPDPTHSPQSTHTTWSTGSRKQFNPNMLDDVAAQAKAATQALKGPHSGDGRPYIPPRRSKTLAKKKSRRNPGKVIGTPQLLTTTQQMSYAQPIPHPDKTLRSPRSMQGNMMSSDGNGKAKQRPIRQPTDYSNDPKTAPATLIHRRRSSSFGHSGQLPDSSPFAQARKGGAGPFSEQGHSFGPAGPYVTAGNGAGLSAASDKSSIGMGLGPPRSPIVAPGTPNSARNHNSGGLGRLMSRMRMRKPSEASAATTHASAIDPYTPGTPTTMTTNGGDIASGGGSQRGPSPFGLMSTQPQSRLSESGAGAFASPMSEQPPQMTRSAASNDQLSTAGSVAAGTAARESIAQNSFARSSVAQSNEGGGGGGGGGGDPQQPPRLGSPAMISPSGGGDAASTSAGSKVPAATSMSREQSASRLSPIPKSGLSQSPSNDGSRPGFGAAGGLTPPKPATRRNSDNSDGQQNGSSSRSSPNGDPDKAAKRKSARDTIIRRTLIFPSEAAFSDEKRRSMASMSSRRKSRRHPELDGEAHAHYAALLGSASSPRRSQEVMNDSSVLASPSRGGGSAGDQLTASSSRQSRIGGRGTSLRPPSPIGSTRRASTAAQSSYAGSLYDMYIGDDGGSAYDGEGGGEGGFRGSMYQPQRNHIEVTERADGSVVWQVIAGLGGAGAGGDGYARNSSYTGYSGHSRVNSDVSQLSFMRPASIETSPPGINDAPGVERTFTGLLKDEDSRSLFAKQRSHKRSFSFDRNGANMPPMPDLPPLAQTWASAQRDRLSGAEASERPAQAQAQAQAPNDGTGSIAPGRPSFTASSTRGGEQLAFDMATPNAGVTRVVYSNDVELEQLLESLARQTDAAKFHFDPRTYLAQQQQAAAMGLGVGGNGSEYLYQPGVEADSGPGRPFSASTSSQIVGAATNRTLDESMPRPRDISVSASAASATGLPDPRRRVEDEIMTLLSAAQAQEGPGGAGNESQQPWQMTPIPGSGTIAQGEDGEQEQWGEAYAEGGVGGEEEQSQDRRQRQHLSGLGIMA